MTKAAHECQKINANQYNEQIEKQNMNFFSFFDLQRFHSLCFHPKGLSYKVALGGKRKLEDVDVKAPKKTEFRRSLKVVMPRQKCVYTF